MRDFQLSRHCIYLLLQKLYDHSVNVVLRLFLIDVNVITLRRYYKNCRLVASFTSDKRWRKEATEECALKLFCSVTHSRAIILRDFSQAINSSQVRALRCSPIVRERKRDELHRTDVSPPFRKDLPTYRFDAAMRSCDRMKSETKAGGVGKPRRWQSGIVYQILLPDTRSTIDEDLTYVGFEITSSPQKWHSCPLWSRDTASLFIFPCIRRFVSRVQTRCIRYE